jgi:hypothetical protein
MGPRNLGRFKSNGLLLLKCACAFVLAAAATSYLRSQPPEGVTDQTSEEGYDFKAAADESNPGAGPKLGERLNLSLFRGSDGATLRDAMRGRAAVVALVDYECDMVRDATDQLRGVREHLAPRGIGYYLVSLNPGRDPADFFHYADSLGLRTASFSWSEGAEIRPSSFWMMVRPSHLLLDGDGTVLLKWPGTSADPQTRRRLWRQIVADTLRHPTVSSR